MKAALQSLRSAIGRRWNNMRSKCAMPSCPSSPLKRSVSHSSLGIRVGDDWYCSLDCFKGAARIRFFLRSLTRTVEMPHAPRMSLGLVMLSREYLTDEQLRFATAQSQLHGEDLEMTLVRLGLANEWQIAAAKAAQWGYPAFGSDKGIQPVEADLPASLLRISSSAPLHYSASTRRLVLGFVHRVEHSLLDSLEQMIGCKVEACFIPPAKFQAQMTHLSIPPGYREIVLEEPLAPSQMAETLCSFAVEIHANEARFAYFREFAWVRLCGCEQILDVLFRGKITLESGGGDIFSHLDENISSLA